MCVFSHIRLFATLCSVAFQAPLFLEFWMPFPAPEKLPEMDQTASLESPALAGGFYIMVLPGKHLVICRKCYIYNLPFI